MLFSMSKKMDTIYSLFAWAFLTVAPRDKRWSIGVRLALPPYCSVDSFYLWSKNSTIIHLPFSPLLYLQHLLEKFDENLKGLLSLFKVLILKLLQALTVFQKSILAAKFCCIWQGECLILLVEGVSTFLRESYPGQEQFFVAWLAQVTTVFE